MSDRPVSDGGKLVIPEQWKEILSAVQEYHPQAIIAGGALRDLWHGKPIKDVDIFVPVVVCDDDLYENLILSLDPYAEKIASSIYGQSQEGEPQPGFRHIHVIWRLTLDEIVYEIIFIEDRGEDLISVFDLSLAQIGYDGRTLRTTAAFNQTILDKVVRVLNVNRADRGAKRLERVLSKYPEYRAETIQFDFP